MGKAGCLVGWASFIPGVLECEMKVDGLVPLLSGKSVRRKIWSFKILGPDAWSRRGVTLMEEDADGPVRRTCVPFRRSC